jgi:phosphoglycolate phosphatase
MQTTVGVGDNAANVAAYRAHHPSVMRTGTRLLPGAAEALRALHAPPFGLKLGVCSNKPVAFTRELVAFLGVADCLTLLLGPEDVARPKPAPDMLLAALARLGLSAGEVLYVGDMVVDIETARAAGVRVWVVATGSEAAAALDRARPDRRLHDLGELPALLAGEPLAHPGPFWKDEG